MSHIRDKGDNNNHDGRLMLISRQQERTTAARQMHNNETTKFYCVLSLKLALLVLPVMIIFLWSAWSKDATNGVGGGRVANNEVLVSAKTLITQAEYHGDDRWKENNNGSSRPEANKQQLLRQKGKSNTPQIEENSIVTYYEDDDDLPNDDGLSSGSPIQRFLKSGGDSRSFNDDYPCYRSIRSIYKTMHKLSAQYPNLVTVKVIGKSYWKQQDPRKGNHIKVMILGSDSSHSNNNNMMIVGGHHSREFAPPETILRWAEYLLENYGTNNNDDDNNAADITWILNRTKIHLVPLANPDGRQIVQDDLKSFHRDNGRDCPHPGSSSSRKSTDSDSGLCPDDDDYDDDQWMFKHDHHGHKHFECGVDLNRNYPMWYGDKKGRASEDRCSETYQGTGPLSEPETQAIFKYASGLFPDSIKKGTPEEAMERSREACPTNSSGIVMDIHCGAGHQVYFPWGYKDMPSPNHQSLLTMAAKLAKPGNFDLWGPQQKAFIYPASGDFIDAIYGIDCILSQGFEISPLKYTTCTELENKIMPAMKESLLYAAKCVSAPYSLALGPDVLSIAVDTTDPGNVNMVVEVSDEAMIVKHAIFDDEADRSQPIKQVQVFVDKHPYDAAAIRDSNLMDPEDGAFDSKREVATLTMDLSHLTGRHTLYFQATDTDGYAGPASAFYIDIKATEEGTKDEESTESSDKSSLE